MRVVFVPLMLPLVAWALTAVLLPREVACELCYPQEHDVKRFNVKFDISEICWPELRTAANAP